MRNRRGILNATDYHPPRWLRSPHLQSLLGSLPLRRRRGAQALAATGAVTTIHIVDGGDGIRLQGLHSVVPGTTPRALALLLHGWEGSVESSYMQLTAAQLLARGFEVFRLNFRDHGDTHHLNEDVFHSNRLEEVVQAARDVSRRFAARPDAAPLPVVVAGYSLGGNFALRLALRAPSAGLSLLHVASVCPVLDPDKTMQTMEHGFPLYHWYFQHKWKRSLRRKRDLFPLRNGFDDRTLALDMRGLTRWLIEKYTDFDSLEGYFDGYAITGDRLARLSVPASLLTSADDPIIPVADFRALRLPDTVTLEIAAHGGHCGFLDSARCDGFAERWVAQQLDAAVAASVAPSTVIPA